MNFEENGIHLTKRLKKLFQEFRNEFPSAALKGVGCGIVYLLHKNERGG